MQQNKVLTFMEATGVIRYKMTNNYMFRFILQKNKKVLTGLICSLLYLEAKEIQKIEITNPINLSGEIAGKEFILDIHVMMNDNTLINLEMQVGNEYNWPERSISYACRGFDNLQKGQEYEDVLPMIHIGFLDYTPFKEYPEFYSKYLLTNVKNNHVYSDKFIIRVVNLKKIDMATEEDKKYKIDYWARLFKAETWEEIKMLTGNNEFLQEAAESLYVANADDIVRQQCQAREDAEKRERTILRDKNKLEMKIENLKDEISRKENELSKKENELSKKENELAQKDEYIQFLKDQLAKAGISQTE